ncbi:MAG TPA: tRNA-dihydrouridine synthase, partial [Candidatus Methylomirabilis sp.]|nr:tRNA-dihydrouridine synthase [Candidatus Methylomirabilis sp.]
CGKFGADVVYSEMVSATALAYGNEKTWELMKSFRKNGGAKFVVQLFGNNPEHFAKAVKLIEKKIKPDGIDINFGCPVMKIMKSCAGAKLFQDLEQSRRVLEAVLRATKLPVSVKVRVSASSAGKTHPVRAARPPLPRRGITVFDFLEKMKDLNIAAIMVHGRTLAQGFSGEVDYSAINRLKKKFKGVVIANGGIHTPEDAEIMLKKTNADGIGIGQGACGHPEIFRQIREKREESLPADAGHGQGRNINEVFKIALEHAKLMHKLKGKQGILEMRKHLCWYVRGLENASELRKEFVKVETLFDIKKLLK